MVIQNTLYSGVKKQVFFEYQTCDCCRSKQMPKTDQITISLYTNAPIPELPPDIITIILFNPGVCV